MLREAAALWRELEDESGVSLLDLVGITNHGAGIAPDLDEALGALGVRASMLTPDEAHERWAGIRFDTRVVHTPEAGRLDAEEAVAALQSEAARHGGEVLLDTRVDSIRVRPMTGPRCPPRTRCTSRTPSSSRRARGPTSCWARVVALPRLVVTQEQPAHFAVSDPAAVWPGFNHLPEPGNARYDYWYSQIYGTLTPGEGVKAGWHAVGPVTDPDARTFEPEPVQLAALQRYAREWLPGVDADVADPDQLHLHVDRRHRLRPRPGRSGRRRGRLLGPRVQVRAHGRADPGRPRRGRRAAGRDGSRRPGSEVVVDDGAVLCHECYAEPVAMPDCLACGGTGRATRMPLGDDPWNEVVPGLFMGGHDVRAQSPTACVVTDQFDLVVSLTAREG